MPDTVERARLAAGALVRGVRDARLTFLAAAVAYYAFVSIVPLLLVGLALGSALLGEDMAAFVVDAAGGALAPGARDVLRDAVLAADDRAGLTLLGVALLLWSGLRVFRGLDAAFSQVYGVERPEGLAVQVVDAATVLAGIGLAATAAVVIGGVVPAMDVLPGWLAALPLALALAAALFPVYYVFPDVALTPREVLPGTAFAALGWTVLTGAFALYASSVDDFAVYGLLGAALLLVTWLYLAGIVIILGAVLNAVLAGRPDDEAEDATADDRDEAAPDVAALGAEVAALRDRLEERTVSRDDLEADLRRYVRARLRRGHARGWGPYLVLGYGTAMTVGAFYFLEGGWAILAMVVIWLSTLGLYALMLLLGAGIAAAGLPGRVLDWVRARRS